MRVFWLASVVALTLGSCATPPDQPADGGRYLAKGAFDAKALLPPPPAKGSPAELRDREIFRATRALEGSPRWSLAHADNVKENVLDGYACALGFTPTRENSPKLAATLLRMSHDVKSAVSGPKMKYHRPRPFWTESGPLCIKPSLSFRFSPDYPSGHSTWGWSVGLLLAQVAPDRSDAILARAKAFGESRVVCGMHNASSVEAGSLNARNLFSALETSPAFRADLAAVRTEMDAARARAPAPDKARCEADTAILARPIVE
jgi:acid phosphatase (class A)